MRVVFLILDAMPPGVVSPTATPNLWAQVLEGGRAPMGGQSLPISVTYSNHAAFMTGVGPEQTGLWGNAAWVDGKFLPTYEAGPRATTLFDRCKQADLRAVVAVGDHKLITTMGALVADRTWPPTAETPVGADLDAFGYLADSAVIEAVGRMDLEADLIVLHLNEPDTTLHVYGPDSVEFAEQVGLSDASYGQLVEFLKPDWDNTILITVSDHQQEQITHPESVNLRAACDEQGWNANVVHDGTAAVLVGELQPDVVRAVDGVEAVWRADEQTLIAWTEPGRMFSIREPRIKGNHGSPRCRPQVAIISGGHELVPALARQIETRRPTTLTWAPLIQSLLGFEGSALD